MTQPPPKKTTPAPSDWRAFLAIVGVALAASVAGLANNYAQDDLHLILGNERVQGLGDWYVLLTSPFWPPPYSQDLYRPLTSLLHALEYELGAGAPMVYRIVSYLLLAAAATQVFALGKRILPRTVAFAVALLFAAHPVHVEATALAVGQSELIVGLIGLVMTTRYLDRRRAGALSRHDWMVLGVLYAIAILVKEQGYILPGLFVGVELLLVTGPLRERARSLIGGYVALLAILVAMLLLRHAVLGGELAGTFVAEALVGLGVAGRALTMLRVVPHWLRLLAWPAHLQGDYSPQEIIASAGFGPLEALGLGLVVAAIVLALIAWKRAPVVAFGLVWCAVTLLPVSNMLIPTGILLAERTLFLPSVGFLLVLGGLAAWPWLRGVGAPRELSREIATLCAVLVGLGILRSVQRQQDWKNEPVYAIRSVRDAPRSFRTQRGFGDLLFDLGQPQPALEAYERAIALSPPALAWRVHNDLAKWLRRTGDRAREVAELRKSLEGEPSQRDTRGFLVAALLAIGLYADAARECDSALSRGLSADVFTRLRATADSAAQVGAPPGSIDIRLITGPVRPSP